MARTLCCWAAFVVAVSSLGVEGRTSGIYINNEIQQTVLVRSLSSRQRQDMEKEILHLLGLHNKPRPLASTRENSAPRFMLDIYRSLNNDEEDVHQNLLNHNMLHLNSTLSHTNHIQAADMIMSFVNHAPLPTHRETDGARHYYFDFKKVPVSETLTGAELRMYKLRTQTSTVPERLTVVVYRHYMNQYTRRRGLLFEANITILSSYQGWVEVNMTGAATQWTYFPNRNLGLYMIIVDKKGKPLNPSLVGIVDDDGPSDKKPFMVAFFKSSEKLLSRRVRSVRKRQRAASSQSEAGWKWGRKSRPKQGVRAADDRYGKHLCQRRTLYVSFKDLQWQNWIIAPDGYAAFFCYGECTFPFNANMNATNHAIVQTLVNIMNHTLVPKPCCAPTKHSAISVLYFDDNSNVILKKYRNMVVRACGCH